MGCGGGTAKARQDFPQSITADSIKGLGQVYESCMQTCVLFSAFLLYLPQHAGHVYGPSVGPEPTLAFSGEFSCAIVGMSLFSRECQLSQADSRLCKLSPADLCNAFLEHHDRTFPLGAH